MELFLTACVIGILGGVVGHTITSTFTKQGPQGPMGPPGPPGLQGKPGSSVTKKT